jgi:pimeloyl-ACP methyl ester carboxylesterase
MRTEPIHRTLSDDGTQIVGSVHGRGPNLVLVPGGPGDGEFSFRSLVTGLADHFTCFAMSTRGKGLSSGHPDHSADRLTEDVRAFVESLGEPATVLGHSSGAMLALEAAACTDAVSALALYEPAVFDTISDEQAATLAGVFASIADRVDAGRSREAAQLFYEQVARANEEESAGLAHGREYDLAGRNLESVLRQVQQSGPPRLSRPDLPSGLAKPVLVMVGTRTAPIFSEAARRLAGRLPDATVVEIEGAGHLGPQLLADRVAETVIRFLSRQRTARQQVAGPPAAIAESTNRPFT